MLTVNCQTLPSATNWLLKLQQIDFLFLAHVSSASKTSQPPQPKVLAIETQGDLGMSQYFEK